ncbi:hypothetical protein LCGC14_0963640 [marine sediment metagenome]|uniref:Uncharacterized protein n=1 Tax=marine sediment metagenome TaxID=412755 RepID=A0A0F9QWW4_9ZZZZ|nr:hypothetical protein [Candidatus Aminicenantes bacterium]
MNKREYVPFWIALWLITMTVIVGSIRNINPTNVSEYMIRQDERIATQSAKIVELENEVQEDIELFKMFEDRLTKKEVDGVWAEWNREVCPQYHDYYFCESAKGSYQ